VAYLVAVWNGPVLPARDRAAVLRMLRELATSLYARRRRPRPESEPIPELPMPTPKSGRL
jgi:hypothetical protein